MTEIMEELQSLYVSICPDKRSGSTVRVLEYVTYTCEHSLCIQIAFGGDQLTVERS